VVRADPVEKGNEGAIVTIEQIIDPV